ncbi:MAG: isoprenylcysteine carboxylmethyltransferase family protein [Bacteroidota bacterium]
MNVLLLAGWAFYFFLHSFLATFTVKNFIANKLPKFYSYYRLVYNGIAILGLLVLLHFSLMPISTATHVILGACISFIGLFFLFQAFRVFNLREFLGLSPEKSTELIVTGMYRYVRHPLYFGTLILVAGIYLIFPSKNMFGVLILSFTYILIGSKLEERKLRNHFGQAYADYAKKVKALIPYVY